MLQISDIKAICNSAHIVGAKVVVDNTFMSPYFQNPLDLGADMVMHSLTKYINGHSDVFGGAIMLNDSALYEKLWYLQNLIGPSQSPFDSWLVLRGVKTLSVRMRTHEENRGIPELHISVVWEPICSEANSCDDFAERFFAKFLEVLNWGNSTEAIKAF